MAEELLTPVHVLATATANFLGILGTLIVTRVQRAKQQSRRGHDPTLGEIKVAMFGIDGKNGLRGDVQDMKMRIEDLGSSVEEVKKEVSKVSGNMRVFVAAVAPDKLHFLDNS